MKNFFKYLATSKEDMEWGIYLNSAGSQKIPVKSSYPPEGHPSAYSFTWEQGRILPEYQLNYIIDGAGIMETDYGKFQVKTGSLMVIFPGEWHRYRPLATKGWTENYIGFNGNALDTFFAHPRFNKTQAVIQIGEREEILDIFLKLFDLLEKEHPEVQQIVSGLIIKL